MNETLQRLRTLARQQTQVNQQADADVVRRAELAAPLIRAWRDIENEFVQIPVMRQIWPSDYASRDDRLAALLTEMPGAPQYPYALKLLTPDGEMTFEVVLASDRSGVYRSLRTVTGLQPLTMTFNGENEWLDFFYKTISNLIEI